MQSEDILGLEAVISKKNHTLVSITIATGGHSSSLSPMELGAGVKAFKKI